MLLTISITLGIFALISAVVTGWAMSQAPVGFEDETGYHPGVQPPPAQTAAPRAETAAGRAKSVVLDPQESEDVLQVSLSAKRLGSVTQGRSRVSVH
jgi:hypothetical protein